MQQKETLSAYMDGEKADNQFIDELCNNPELQQKWANYHLTRSIMQGEEILLGNDFSAKMEALLENEVIGQSETEQATEKPRGLLLKLKRWGTPLMQAGIAASVCLVAVLGVNMVNNNSNEVAQKEAPVLQTLPFVNNGGEQVSYNAPNTNQPTAQKLVEQQLRINALLQNHELQRRTNPAIVTQKEEDKAKAQTSSTQPAK